MRMNLTPAQILLLKRLRRGPLTFTGAESDEDRLAMLQLLIAGLVSQGITKTVAISWRITPLGDDAIRGAAD